MREATTAWGSVTSIFGKEAIQHLERDSLAAGKTKSKQQVGNTFRNVAVMQARTLDSEDEVDDLVKRVGHSNAQKKVMLLASLYALRNDDVRDRGLVPGPPGSKGSLECRAADGESSRLMSYTAATKDGVETLACSLKFYLRRKPAADTAAAARKEAREEAEAVAEESVASGGLDAGNVDAEAGANVEGDEEFGEYIQMDDSSIAVAAMQAGDLGSGSPQLWVGAEVRARVEVNDMDGRTKSKWVYGHITRYYPSCRTYRIEYRDGDITYVTPENAAEAGIVLLSRRATPSYPPPSDVPMETKQQDNRGSAGKRHRPLLPHQPLLHNQARASPPPKRFNNRD